MTSDGDRKDPTGLARILLVEDDTSYALQLEDHLVDATLVAGQVDHVSTLAETLDHLRDGASRPDAVLLSLNLPDASGLETVRAVVKAAPDLPVVVLTPSEDRELALKALRERAEDCLPRDDVDPDYLARSIQYALERKRAQRKLEEARRKLALLDEHLQEVFYLWDFSTEPPTLAYCSSAYEKIWGRDVEEVTRDPLTFIEGIHPEDRERVRENLDAKLRGERHLDYRVTRPDGELRWIRDRSYPIRDEEGEVRWVAGSAVDITDQKRFEEQLQHQSLHDRLTGLPNRALFWNRLEHALERSRRTGEQVAVLFLDLDGFKRINDEHGHAAGDEALRRVADRLRSAVREADTLARLGGDEFGVLLEDLEEESDAVKAARRLTDRFEPAVAVAGEEVLIHVSCGIALAGDDGRGETAVTPDELVNRADRAMYVAKEVPGSSSHLYSPDWAGQRTGRLRREVELKEALEKGEIMPYYQPIVDLEDGRIVGAEALARWEHPDRGLLSPEEFIPLAEETGLIVELGRKVTRSACVQLADWRERGLVPEEFRLNVNLSGRELDDPDVVEGLEDLFREVGLDPERVAFEVTESVAVGSYPVLDQIRNLGSAVAVDDFGTEYATLQRLAETNLDSLKVDRSFVGGIGASDRHEAVLEASLTLADSMDLCAVAEGVETEEQRAGLLERGCQFAQGFLFARAVPAAELEDWLEERRSLPVE